MTKKASKNAKIEESKSSAKKAIESATISTIARSVSQKHNIAERATKSTKDLKAERSKNRRILINFANQNFVLSETKQSEAQKVNAKQFVSYIAKHYNFTNFPIASELYSAKDLKVISDIQNLIDFAKSAKIAYKVHEDLKA